MNLVPVGPVGPRGFPGIGTLTSSIGQTDFGENNQVLSDRQSHKIINPSHISQL